MTGSLSGILFPTLLESTGLESQVTLNPKPQTLHPSPSVFNSRSSEGPFCGPARRQRAPCECGGRSLGPAGGFGFGGFGVWDLGWVLGLMLDFLAVRVP